ncbi:helix-turn-helix domain-containing protein [Oceanobacillus saliphilus]|uniref:helix-turn-helix domain-containing protein n=1 Tax=Oceanobacillus saliphilus TaxID=2925834 RepID=UPI00201D4C6E
MQSEVISAAMKIFQVTNLNTYILNANNELIYNHEIIDIPEFMPGSGQEDLFLLLEKMEQRNQLYSYINEWGLHYFAYALTEQNNDFTVVIGPYFDATPNLYSLSREYDLNSIDSENLRAVSEKIHVLTVEQATSFASVLQQFQMMMNNDVNPRIIETRKNKSSETKKVEYAARDEDMELVKLRYKIETDFMFAVGEGDKTEALKLINSRNMLFSFSERFPNQPLRRLKNLAIIMNTLLRTAARNSNVPAIMIHRISEKYAYEIENASKIATLNPLQDKMIEAYCNLIASNSLSGYSTMTQRVMEHLLSYYDKQIDKNELADLCNTHPSHLSRKFKQETGMTITLYQQMVRINKSKHLLRTEDLSIEEIAWIVGYEDSSYFARVFKKDTGYTPSQYREGSME